MARPTHLYSLAIGVSGCVMAPQVMALTPSEGADAAITAREEQDGEGPQTIIVTARRREEELQRAPVSVVALSARDLEARSFTHLRALQNFVPNVTFAPSAAVGE